MIGTVAKKLARTNSIYIVRGWESREWFVVWAIRKPSARSLLYLPYRFAGLHTFFGQMYIFWPHEEVLADTSGFPTACAPHSFNFYEICIWICNPKMQREHSTALETIAIMWYSPILEEHVEGCYIGTLLGNPRGPHVRFWSHIR